MNTQVGGFSNGVNYNVGGGRPRANNFLIEGQDNNDAGIQGQGLQPGNDEAVKEVVIIENAYTAEYGLPRCRLRFQSHLQKRHQPLSWLRLRAFAELFARYGGQERDS